MRTRMMTSASLFVVLAASGLAACAAEVGTDGASGTTANAQAPSAAAAPVAEQSGPREFLPEGSTRTFPAGGTIHHGLTFDFNYPTTLVGTAGNVTVYYDPILGTPGQLLAQQLLGRVAGPYADMQKFFGVSGGHANVIIAPLSGKNDGSGGAGHGGCDFTSGGDLYVDATFANTTVDPLAWEIGLYVAELSESFMGVQNKGWGCGSSNGEGLSRYLAQYEMAPNQMPAWGITGPSWANAGFPDWISVTEPKDRDYVSTGASTVYINWMLSLGYSITQITQAGGSTLAANYQTLTGQTGAYTALTTALSGLPVLSDNPWNVAAELGVEKFKGDFNGDGREDILIVDAAGSYEYLGNVGGGFTANAWTRTDLKLNAVNYIPGDFNGDGRSDLVIVTHSGSYEYLGNAGGGFTANAWSRTDLPLGKVSYVPGDFNGDGKTDLIIVTAGGSYEYTGLAGGGFTANAWSRSDLTLRNVEYVPGDFNGDGYTDVIAVSAGGSSEFTGLPGGGFTTGAWSRSDLPLGNVNYVAGDFNGDARADLIITTAGGSYEYTGLSAGGFTANAWTRTDLPLGLVRYATGDFNGDGKADLIITTAGGSYEYEGLAGGGFTANAWTRTDLVMAIVDYATGDFNGDGKSDLIIMTPSGSYEYTGLAAGSFTGGVWTRTVSHQRSRDARRVTPCIRRWVGTRVSRRSS